MTESDDRPSRANGAAIIPSLVVLGLVVTGLVLRVSALTPKGLLAIGSYDWVFEVHQALGVASVPVIVLHAIPTRRPLVLARVVASLVFVSSAGLLLTQRSAWGGAPSGIARVAFLLLSWAHAPLFLVAAFVVVLLALVRRKREEDEKTPSFFEWLRRAQIVFFVESAALAGILQQTRDQTFLSDTLFVAASMHFAVFVLLLEVVRSLAPPRPTKLATGGLIATATGAQLFSVSCMILGSRGMPLRYMSYLPDFQPLQGSASLGAFVLSLGLAVLLVAYRL